MRRHAYHRLVNTKIATCTRQEARSGYNIEESGGSPETRDRRRVLRANTRILIEHRALDNIVRNNLHQSHVIDKII